jgi:hypothetical protein
MKKIIAALSAVFAIGSANAAFVDYVNGSNPAPGTSFTKSEMFVPSSNYTSYTITCASMLQFKTLAGAYKYTTISNVQLKDQSGNIISVSWTHVQTTLLTGVTGDSWAASGITGLTNGMTYNVVVTGAGIGMGVSGTVLAVPFVISITAQ